MWKKKIIRPSYASVGGLFLSRHINAVRDHAIVSVTLSPRAQRTFRVIIFAPDRSTSCFSFYHGSAWIVKCGGRPQDYTHRYRGAPNTSCCHNKYTADNSKRIKNCQVIVTRSKLAKYRSIFAASYYRFTPFHQDGATFRNMKYVRPMSSLSI